MPNNYNPTDAEWAPMAAGERLLWLYELTFAAVQAGVPSVVCTLTTAQLKPLHGADLDQPDTLTDEQAELFSLLCLRAAVKLANERAQREREQAGGVPAPVPAASSAVADTCLPPRGDQGAGPVLRLHHAATKKPPERVPARGA